MSTQPIQALAPVYTCQICRRTLMMQGPLIIGEKADARLAKVGAMLAEHLGKEHKKELAAAMLIGNNIAGWTIVNFFDHNDAAVGEKFEQVRKQLRKITRRVNVTDELIEKQVNAMLPSTMFSAEDAAWITHLLKTLRNTMDEVPAA